MKNRYGLLKLACYSANISMAVVANLSPLLFITFRSMYGISYSLLGFLVLICFLTQLVIDLIFSFYSHKFNIPLVVKSMPFICFVGLIIFALAPTVYPKMPYIILVFGTIIFSVSAGLCEVLISPVIAEIPSENPEREMSKLHSVYAWGVVGVVLFATLFLYFFGQENWQKLALLFSCIPIFCGIIFLACKVPDMKNEQTDTNAVLYIKNKGVWLCVLGIFLGGASECTMGQWVSGYLEAALKIPKIWGDVFGTALFAVALGLGRTLYSKIGKNVTKALLFGAIGASVCYFVAAVTPFAIIGLFSCAFTGFCVSMLWPGSLVVASDRYPKGGVIIFALMAAGGDMGASVGPQLIGLVTDGVLKLESANELAKFLSIAPEQLGMKIGMLVGMIFPIFAIFVYSKLKKGEILFKNQ